MKTLTQEISDFRLKFKTLVSAQEIRTIEEGLLQQELNRGLGGIAKVGEVVPDFSFRDQRGELIRLQELTMRGTVVLVFYRGGWCPYCNLELQSYQRQLDRFSRLGATVIALSPERPENAQTTAEANGLRFSVGTDEGLSIARSLGIVFPVTGALKQLYEKFGHPLSEMNAQGLWELPVPGTFVLGAGGRIDQAYLNLDYRERLDPVDLLASLEVSREH